MPLWTADGVFEGMGELQNHYAGIAKQENDFQEGIRKTAWWNEYVKDYGEEPDLETPDYDYRRAWAAGVRPDTRDPTDGKYHWSSEFKGPNHKNRYVDGIDTITGKPVKGMSEMIPPSDPYEQVVEQNARDKNHTYRTDNTPENADRWWKKWRRSENVIDLRKEPLQEFESTLKSLDDYLVKNIPLKDRKMLEKKLDDILTKAKKKDPWEGMRAMNSSWSGDPFPATDAKKHWSDNHDGYEAVHPSAAIEDVRRSGKIDKKFKYEQEISTPEKLKQIPPTRYPERRGPLLGTVI